jgi:hypothetical protein
MLISFGILDINVDQMNRLKLQTGHILRHAGRAIGIAWNLDDVALITATPIPSPFWLFAAALLLLFSSMPGRAGKAAAQNRMIACLSGSGRRKPRPHDTQTTNQILKGRRGAAAQRNSPRSGVPRRVYAVF